MSKLTLGSLFDGSIYTRMLQSIKCGVKVLNFFVFVLQASSVI